MNSCDRGVSACVPHQPDFLRNTERLVSVIIDRSVMTHPRSPPQRGRINEAEIWGLKWNFQLPNPVFMMWKWFHDFKRRWAIYSIKQLVYAGINITY